MFQGRGRRASAMKGQEERLGAQSVERLRVGFGSGHDLMGHEMEHSSSPPLSGSTGSLLEILSPSPCPSPLCMHALSLSNKQINLSHDPELMT